jgi:hypothetical protein
VRLTNNQTGFLTFVDGEMMVHEMFHTCVK